MQRYIDIVRDELGNAITGAEVRVYIGDSTTLATVYDGDDNVVGQPLDTDSAGMIANGAAGLAGLGFKAPGGRYRLNVKKGTDEFDLPDVLIGEAQGYDQIDMIQASAANTFENTTDGLAATAAGEFFWVADTAADDILTLYLNDAGVAVSYGGMPSGNDLRTAVAQALAYRDQIAAYGGFFADTTAGLAGTSDGEIFSVANDPVAGDITIYRNDAGVATAISTFISAGPTADDFLTKIGFSEYIKSIRGLEAPPISRSVATTLGGSTGVEDGAFTWAKLATFSIGTSGRTINARYMLVGRSYRKAPIVEFSVRLRSDVTGYEDVSLSLDVHSITDTTVIVPSSLRLVIATDSLGSNVELWVQKRTDYNRFRLYETGMYRDEAATTVVYHDAAAWQSADPTTGAAIVITGKALQREKLTADRIYYVRTDGSNDNDGLTDSASGAFATGQAAINMVADTLDLNGYDVKIYLRDGTYTTGIIANRAFVGGGKVYLIGNLVTPGNVLINVTSSHAIASLHRNASLVVDGVKLQTTTAGDCLNANQGEISFGKVDFGACAGAHIAAQSGGRVVVHDDYTISGSAPIHVHSFSRSSVVGDGVSHAVTLTGTPDFSLWFAGVADAGAYIPGPMTFSGGATGVRFLVHKNGVIDVSDNAGSDENYLPGDVAGSQATGGKFIHAGNLQTYESPNAEVWTPTLTFDVPGDLAVTYAVRVGRYIKHGDLVTVIGNIVTSSFTHTTASGKLRVTGLPYTSVNVPELDSPGSLIFGGLSSVVGVTAQSRVLANTNRVIFTSSAGASPPADVTNAHAVSGNTIQLRFVVQYIAA